MKYSTKQVHATSLIAGIAMASVSLYMSAHGLIDLLAGAGMTIVVFAVVMELGKVASLIEILRRGRLTFMTFALTLTTLFLVGVNTVGVYGYLGRAYAFGQKEAVVTHRSAEALGAEIELLSLQRDRLFAQIEAIPETHSTNRHRVMQEVNPQITRLDSLLFSRQSALTDASVEVAGAEHDVGQLKYAAERLGMSGDELARWVIMALALLLDPLAVLLILSSGVHHVHRRDGDEQMRAHRPLPAPREAEAPVALTPEESNEVPSLVVARGLDEEHRGLSAPDSREEQPPPPPRVRREGTESKRQRRRKRAGWSSVGGHFEEDGGVTEPETVGALVTAEDGAAPKSPLSSLLLDP